MITPYNFNKFNNSNLLFQYLEYLSNYLTKIEMTLQHKRFYLDKKLHVQVDILDNDNLLFQQSIKATDINDYKNFNTNLYYELDYYIISKELTLNHIRNDAIQNFTKLKNKQNFDTNGFHIIRKQAYQKFNLKKNKLEKILD
ncbi:hypothetical protein [Methylovorus glucosotrophus]|uniref:Uncharacterized protein n=1 Tax=Methylovorus glucosotrophus (strain SIP3-4) TaxID=582744 RepID=C6X7W0_METGS|nr:hypothetical protein [Methylovorus glucosotrophus]ACT51287.1 hypothetical protein Msip34_2045 [Methylovorus glucosotrophus SIP3-4]